MNNYDEAFEALANRGAPAGATALLERIDLELADPGRAPTAAPRRRWSGPILAAAVFIAILGVGLTWNLLLAPSGDVAHQPDPEIDWIEISGDAFHNSVVAGPGGFIKVPIFIEPNGPGPEFSTDGTSWTAVSLPGLERSALRQIAVSNASWLMILDDGDAPRAWASTDAAEWASVEWPDGLQGRVQYVAGFESGFVATSADPFGSGPGYWLSADGLNWTRADDKAPENSLFVDVIDAGGRVIWLPNRTDQTSPVDFYHSADGLTWSQGTIELPEELASGSHRWSLEALQYVDGLWIAVGEVRRADADPIIHAWTSLDGATFTARGIVDFGDIGGKAVTLSRFDVARVDGWLLVAPGLVPVAESEDGIRQGQGQVVSTGQVWATQDGVSWTKVLQTDGEVQSIAARVAAERGIVGIWVRHPSQDGDQQPVVTTATPVDPQEMDPEGLELQRQILADGEVTLEELTMAFDGWKACMEERGLIEVAFEIDPTGGVSYEYGSSDRSGGEAEDAACYASYVTDVVDAVPR